MSSVAKIITDTILAKMQEAEKSGTSFRWVKPWNSGLDRAYSYDTQIPYKGVNRLLLENDEYLTFNKMQEINQQKGTPEYQIRKGARSNIVCYYNITPIKDEQTGEPMIDEYTGKELKRGFLKYYRVFSKGDIVRKDNGESLPSKFNFEHFSHEEATEQMKEALDRFNRLFNYYCEKNGIEVQVVQDGTQAYFSHNMKIRVQTYQTSIQFIIGYIRSLTKWHTPQVCSLEGSKTRNQRRLKKR